MRISREKYDDIVAHAQEKSPEECCGIVASQGDDATRVYRTTNTEASQLRFVIAPDEVYRVWKEITDADLDIGAIYHSHTRSEPRPSQTDINFAKDWPGVLWIIIGLADGDPDVRTFEIRDGEVLEAELDVS
jgi:proteasome lid subunit RPN8/RPN11